MTTLITQGRRRCDARCYNGKQTTKCKCICGGRNHAGGFSQALSNVREHCGIKALSVYEFVESPPERLTIRDTGHMDHRSVTNDAENVVADLVASGFLPDGRRLFYYDSQGQLDEILVRNGKFAGFFPGPRPVHIPEGKE